MKFQKTIEKKRKKIDKLDKKILLNLAERISIAKDIADYKIKNDIPVYQKEREKEILQKLTKLGKENDLRDKFIDDIFNRIIKESRLVQKKRIHV
jgi:chorismate mutase